jgi:hypothetical protein
MAAPLTSRDQVHDVIAPEEPALLAEKGLDRSPQFGWLARRALAHRNRDHLRTAYQRGTLWPECIKMAPY